MDAGPGATNRFMRLGIRFMEAIDNRRLFLCQPAPTAPIANHAHAAPTIVSVCDLSQRATGPAAEFPGFARRPGDLGNGRRRTGRSSHDGALPSVEIIAGRESFTDRGRSALLLTPACCSGIRAFAEAALRRCASPPASVLTFLRPRSPRKCKTDPRPASETFA